MSFIKNIMKIYTLFFSCISLERGNKSVAALRKLFLSESKSHNTNQNDLITYNIAIESVRDPLFYSLFSMIVVELRKKISVNSHLLFVTSINAAVGNGWKQKILRSKIINSIKNLQWQRASIPILGDHVAYKSQSFAYPLKDLKDWLLAKKIWKDQQKKEINFSSFKIQGILVGDLIIDSYLRFKPSPEFKICDPFVKKIIWQTLRDIRHAKDFFGKVKPSLYLTSYSTYIEHGIAVRVALKYKVTVRSYGHFAAFGKKLIRNDFYHTPYTSNYSKDFSRLPNQFSLLKKAEKALNFRLSGGIDPATSYMKFSAYKKNKVTVPNVAGQAVIFLHDFYDSPHIYPNLIFQDFWSWVLFTIQTFQQAKINFWIKPHPNQIDLSDKAIKDLIRKFPDLRILPSRVTNKQLAKNGMKVGITVYGTVAHELAYMGIPSITCAKDPHHAFDFCYRATSIKEYRSLLLNKNEILFNRFLFKKQALQFFYMHNFYHGNNISDLQRKYSFFSKIFEKKDINFRSIKKSIADLRSSPGWKNHINILVKDIADVV
jgi:hypothetical protein